MPQLPKCHASKTFPNEPYYKKILELNTHHISLGKGRTIMWVPGHCNIRGNGGVDQAQNISDTGCPKRLKEGSKNKNMLPLLSIIKRGINLSKGNRI